MDKSNTTATTPSTPKPPRTQTVTLTAPSGERLRILAKLHKKSGQAAAYMMLSSAKNGDDGKRTHSRGMTTTHASMDEAVKAVAQLVTQATKAGWVQSQKVVTVKADTFSTMPVPGKAPAASQVPSVTPAPTTKKKK